MLSIHDRFEAVNDEFSMFENIEDPLNPRPDLCAFMLLHSLLPDNDDMIAAGEHDVIYLSIDVNELNVILSDRDLLTLIRCGVSHDRGRDSLMMFV